MIKDTDLKKKNSLCSSKLSDDLFDLRVTDDIDWHLARQVFVEEVGSLLGKIASNGRPSLVLILGHAKLSANLRPKKLYSYQIQLKRFKNENFNNECLTTPQHKQTDRLLGEFQYIYKKNMFYLNKEEIALFNDTLNTFILRLFGIWSIMNV